MSDDIKKIYDFCEFRKNIADNNLEKIEEHPLNIILNTQLVAEGTAYWTIQQFILENFEEGEQNDN